MHFLNLLTLLPAVALALPLITKHQTISSNPIQVHTNPSSWWPSSKRQIRLDFEVKPSNTTKGWSLSSYYRPYLPHDSPTKTAIVTLKDILLYIATNEPASASDASARISVAEESNTTIELICPNDLVLQQVQVCLDETARIVKKVHGDLPMSEFTTFTRCMMVLFHYRISTTSVIKRDVSATETAQLAEISNIASGLNTKPATDAVEGHSIANFWQRLLPHQTPAEIATFLADLGGYYQKKEQGTHSSSSPSPWGKRHLPPDSTSFQLSAGKKKEGDSKANLGEFKLTKGAMVRNGHWDGNMRSKDLDKVVKCGVRDYMYLNERCVKSSYSRDR